MTPAKISNTARADNGLAVSGSRPAIVRQDRFTGFVGSWISNRHGFAGDYCLAQSAAALYRPATRQNSKIIITGPSSSRAVLSTHKFVTLRYRDAVGRSDHCRQWFRKQLFIITSDSISGLDPRHGQIPHRLPERFSFGR